MRIRFAHASGQYSDAEKHQVSDAHTLVAEMRARGWQWLTGTEAGSQSVLAPAFRRIAEEHGLKFRKGSTGDVWMLHPVHLFDEPPEVQWVKTLDGVAGQFADRGVLRVTGDCPLTRSDLTVLTAHYLTHDDPRNEEIADTVGQLARAYGKGRALVFYGGDQNINDQKYDTFMGNPMTSLQDELGKHPGSGHGPIDVLATYNHDARVRAVDVTAFDDKEIHLFSDHYIVEGEVEIGGPR